ncbi:hypothetical protein ACF0H5_018926 [Mactra antiquata]
MLPSISFIQMACRHNVRIIQKHITWNSVRNLYNFTNYNNTRSCQYNVSGLNSLLMRDKCDLYKNSNSVLINIPCRYKGHSHWQNIRSTKAAADKEKHSKISQYNNLMKGAISEYGPNPETNQKLAKILEMMKNSGIPKADIKRYLTTATQHVSSCSNEYFEFRGPRGSIFVLEVETDHMKKSRDFAASLVKKTQCQINDHQSYQNFFDIKGLIEVPIKNDMQVSNMDEYLEIAIESGAEDVILTKIDENDEKSGLVLKFHCDPKTLSKVTKEIENTFDLEISSSKVELQPTVYVTIDSEDDIEACRKIVEKLHSHHEFVALYDNITVPED